MRTRALVLLLAWAPAARAQGPDPDTVALRLTATAADSAVPVADRAAALHALRGRCEPRTFATLTRIGAPYREPWTVWHGALTVLAACPDPELAPLWRGLLAFPRRPVREVAIAGLGRSGSGYDAEVLRQATRREEDPTMRRLAAWADSLLALPLARRPIATPTVIAP